jgi:hypothetical protein
MQPFIFPPFSYLGSGFLLRHRLRFFDGRQIGAQDVSVRKRRVAVFACQGISMKKS